MTSYADIIRNNPRALSEYIRKSRMEQEKKCLVKDNKDVYIPKTYDIKTTGVAHRDL